MKNKIFTLALIAVGLVSCTNDEVVQPTKAVATTSLDIGFKTESQSSTTGKSVNRGDLYAWIKDINITATSTEFTYSTSDLFNLVTTGGESDFHLDNIAIGHNKIDVTTTTSSYPMLITNFVSGMDAINTMAYIKSSIAPYAVYTATINDFNVIQGAPNKLENVELTTNNGRVIAVFDLSETLKQLGVYALVTTLIDGVPVTDFKAGLSYPGQFYWSDANSTNGKTIGFTWKFYKVSDNTLFSPQTFSSSPNLITVVASKSVNKIFTIDNQNLTTNQTDQTSFTAQIWTDEDGSGTLTGN